MKFFGGFIFRSGNWWLRVENLVCFCFWRLMFFWIILCMMLCWWLLKVVIRLEMVVVFRLLIIWYNVLCILVCSLLENCSVEICLKFWFRSFGYCIYNFSMRCLVLKVLLVVICLWVRLSGIFFFLVLLVLFFLCCWLCDVLKKRLDSLNLRFNWYWCWICLFWIDLIKLLNCFFRVVFCFGVFSCVVDIFLF